MDLSDPPDCEIPQELDLEIPSASNCVGLKTSYPIRMTIGACPFSRLL